MSIISYFYILYIAVKNEKEQSITIDMTFSLEMGEDNLKNVGYGILKQLYLDLELDKFWKQKAKGRQFQFNAERFTLDAVYDALDVFAEHQEALQQWINAHSVNICKRDLSISYFDCTNFYFDIGCSDIDLLDDEGKTY